MSELLRGSSGEYTVKVLEACGKTKLSTEEKFQFTEGYAYRLIIYLDHANKLHITQVRLSKLQLSPARPFMTSFSFWPV